MKNLAKAIIDVMKDVKGMEKNSRVGTGKSSYDGTKDADVKEVFNEAMAKHGLCILPIDIQETTQIDRWEEKTDWGLKQKQSVFTKVNTKYLLLHESGESIELAGYGHGVDTQDKGAGKATTYALKNTLLYLFLTPVGKIDDTDTKHSNDIEQPKKASQPKKSEPTESKEINKDHRLFEGMKKAVKEGSRTIAVLEKKGFTFDKYTNNILKSYEAEAQKNKQSSQK
jgi:hypothetical protein